MSDPKPPPSGTASGTEQTIAAGAVASAPTLAEDTLAPPSDVVRKHAGAQPSSKPGSGLSRSVGEEMQAANIERFGTVERTRFELLDELARGGLGRVFRARDPRTNRIVAIKEVLRPHPDIITRFAREAMVTANLQHPAIVPVYEVGRWASGEPFYAMKLVQGRALDPLIEEAKTPEARMALVPHLIVVADALAYAHSERVIHRDLKPANILVGAYGETVVIDWGLAKNLATGEEIEELPHASTLPPDNTETVVGSVLGTPAYMPPEQAQGEKVDERADVYAIGAILYHLLCGERPFRWAKTMEELIELVAFHPPRPIRELAPDAPPELVAIVEKAMARRPDDRYATAEGLAHDLRAFQAGKLVPAHRYTTWELVRRWIGQHKAAVLTAVVALVVLIGVASVGVWKINQKKNIAEAERAKADEQRAVAQEAKALAESRFADSLEELARQALLAKAPDRALPLLEGAARARGGQTTPTASVLAVVASSAYAGLVGIAPPHPVATTSAGLAHGGTWVISADSEGLVRAWDLAANREAWKTTAAQLISVSPDGTRVLGVAKTGELKVLDGATGTLLHTWKAAVPAHVLAWSQDGTHFAAATRTGVVFVGAPDSAQLASVDPHTGVVWAAAFSPDGTQLATGGADGIVMVRDVATGATVTRLAGAPGEIASIAWVDGGRLLSGDNKGVVRLWSVADRRIVRTFQQPADVYGVLTGGADGARWVAAYGDGAVAMVWDLDTGAVLATLTGHAFASDVGTTVAGLLVTTDEAGGTFVWDPRTGERVQTLPNEGAVQGVQASGDRLVVYGTQRTRVWQLGPGRVVRAIPGHTARVRDLAWSADGKTLWSASHDGSARGFDLATGTTTVFGTAGFSEPPIAALPPPKILYPHGLRSLRLSPDGRVLATASEDGSLVLYEIATKREVRLVGHTGRVRRVEFSADMRSAYSVGDTTLRAWDLGTGKQRASAELGASAWDLTFVTDDVIATQNEADPNQVALWRASDLTPIAMSPVQTRFVELPTADGHLVVGTELEVHVLDAAGRSTARMPLSSPGAASIAAGQVVVSGSAGDISLHEFPGLKLIRAWNAGSLQSVVRLRPDAKLLASIGGKSVRLWDPATARLLAEVELPVLLAQLAWSPDGTKLAIAGGSGTVWIWDLSASGARTTDLAAYVKCVSPWRLDDTLLVAAPFDPASCAVLSAPR